MGGLAMKIAIIANAKRADSPLLDKKKLDLLANENGLSYDLYIPKPKEIESLIKELLQKNYHAFLIAGGDGTVRTVVQVLANYEIPIAILPLGTFNYFARELKFPPDIEKLFKYIKNNKTKRVDIGEVNEHIFINHSSIGFYSYILKLKEKHKNWLGTSKLLKIIFTSVLLMRKIPIYNLKMIVDDQLVTHRTCLVFIGNNYHFTNLLDFGERNSLTSGYLAVYILRCKNRWEMLKCIFSIVFNRFDKTTYLTQFITNDLIISSQTNQLNVVIDGELFKLAMPLHYKIISKKLNVVTP
ncbi:MAG: NAD(+)/NADH kinase [Gammaproteobacteria bacterium]|nr:NAD(+)/NADH kinase [Gammaproteobacteria bacterium]